MTLWVSREGQNITIHGNVNLDVKVVSSRVGEFGVTEHAAHLRGVWAELGKAIEAAEAEQAQAG